MVNQSKLYFKQLDALRAFAVILVIISHWFSSDHFLNRYSSNGSLGVTLFFVLSGFLITSILLRSKDLIAKGLPMPQAFKVFYIRRILRISPVYYFLIFILLIFAPTLIKDSFFWHLSYFTNIFFWLKGIFSGPLSHFWSLAVEEQFYLVCPAFIFFIPKRFLIKSFLFGICIGISFRYFMVFPGNDMGRILMPGSIDSFCIGALFAYGRLNDSALINKYLTKIPFSLTIAFLFVFFVHTIFFNSLPANIRSALYFFLISLSFGVIIDKAAGNSDNILFNSILNNRLLIYIGKISYGLYLYLNFIPYF